ncbi:3-deoxy-D-manno-octulosonic acid transferase [Thermodesulfobacteriota bacterium]
MLPSFRQNRLMNPLYTTYKLLGSGMFFTGFPFFWAYTRLSGRYRQGLEERLGSIPLGPVRALKGSPRIWIHAASLGEVKVSIPIIEALRRDIPGCSVMLSTMTEHGRALAVESVDQEVPIFFAPVDTPFTVRRALTRAAPDVMAFLETEIWPVWLTEAHRKGIKTAMINGRISVRAIGRYLRIRPLFREVLKCVDAFSMILEEDAHRIRAMGAAEDKISVNGNAKYDLLAGMAHPEAEQEVRRILNVQPSQKVLIAGSTREGEEVMILDAYEKIRLQFPDTILIIAPRHPARTLEIESLLHSRGLRYHLRSELDRRREPVVIVNTFGELFNLYSVGTIIFCGASMVPLGGQNPLEAAIWGKIVFYGPSMEDFLDAKAMLESVDAGIPVSGPESLAEKAIWFLNHPDELKKRGLRAREALMRHQGAAGKHAGVIAQLL